MIFEILNTVLSLAKINIEKLAVLIKTRKLVRSEGVQMIDEKMDLSVGPDDQIIELIHSNMDDICKILAMKMYEYGHQNGMSNQKN